jgi:hypothetical protein
LTWAAREWCGFGAGARAAPALTMLVFLVLAGALQTSPAREDATPARLASRDEQTRDEQRGGIAVAVDPCSPRVAAVERPRVDGGAPLSRWPRAGRGTPAPRAPDRRA